MRRAPNGMRRTATIAPKLKRNVPPKTIAAQTATRRQRHSGPDKCRRHWPQVRPEIRERLVANRKHTAVRKKQPAAQAATKLRSAAISTPTDAPPLIVSAVKPIQENNGKKCQREGVSPAAC